MIKVYFAKMKETAIIPQKREEDAGYDVFPCFEEDYIMINPNETVKIPTGIASCFSREYCFIVKERSSTGSIGLGQRSGVIDSGYRGEWQLPVTNHSTVPVIIVKDGFKQTKAYEELIKTHNIREYDYKKAIAQALLIPVPRTEVMELTYEELLEFKSERMHGGFGSTNSK
ncbi:MAG: dUTP diphosphatase [Proteocatella sp.]